MVRERWRKVRRAAGYQVSDRGRVRSVARTLSDGRAHGGQLLTPKQDADGYLLVKVAGQWLPVHILVLEAFHGPRPPGTEGCHGPAGQLDNRAEVLRWDTHRENLQDRERNKQRQPERLERNKQRQPERLDLNGTHHPAPLETFVSIGPAGA
jgi:NUMOD4 motif